MTQNPASPTDESGCNGWSNFATWKIVAEHTNEIVDTMQRERSQFGSVVLLADELKRQVTYIVESSVRIREFVTQTPWAIDYARCFIGQANFDEIARTAVGDFPALINAEALTDGM